MPGYVYIQGELQANGDFALSDDGQHRGGFRAVNTVTERDEILPERKKEGMHVFVVEDLTLYRLTGNNTWIKADPPGMFEHIQNTDVHFVELTEDDDIDNLENGAYRVSVSSLDPMPHRENYVLFQSFFFVQSSGVICQIKIDAYGIEKRTKPSDPHIPPEYVVWSEWTNYTSVSSSNGGPVSIWTGNEATLPPQNERIGTKTLYIAL